MKKLLIAAAISGIILSSDICPAKDMVQIKGSDTLINLVQKLSEEYMNEMQGKAIAVTGGGSGNGIAALLNRGCDIANASRLIKAQEIADAASRGVQPKRIVVAIDALSIAVNKSNPISRLTVDEIGKIYRGDVKNWKELGGEDLPITVYGRQSNSGTYEFMKEFVMKGEYTSKMRQMNGNAQIIEAIKQDKTAIGYVGVGYAKGAMDIKTLEVAIKVGGDYVSPFSDDDVKKGFYPITRPLNQYVDGQPSGDVKDFLLFELSEKGQKIVEEEGFFSIPDEYIKHNEAIIGI